MIDYPNDTYEIYKKYMLTFMLTYRYKLKKTKQMSLVDSEMLKNEYVYQKKYVVKLLSSTLKYYTKEHFSGMSVMVYSNLTKILQLCSIY